MMFTGEVVGPTYNCPNPPNVRVGLAVKVEEWIDKGSKERPDHSISYPVGASVGFADSCFNFSASVGDKVLVYYDGESFTISRSYGAAEMKYLYRI